MCMESAGLQSSVRRDGKLESQDVAEMAESETNAGICTVVWFALKQLDELVQNVFSCFSN